MDYSGSDVWNITGGPGTYLVKVKSINEFSVEKLEWGEELSRPWRLAVDGLLALGIILSAPVWVPLVSLGWIVEKLGRIISEFKHGEKVSPNDSSSPNTT